MVGARRKGSLARQAFSLLEILVVMTVIVIALLAMVGVFIRGNQLAKNGEQITLATEVGMIVLEQSKQVSFDLVPDAATFSSVTGDPAVAGFPPLPYEPNSAPAMTVTTSLISPTMKSIVVSVDHGRGHSITLETYVRP